MKKSGFYPIVLPVFLALSLNFMVSCANSGDAGDDDIDAISDAETPEGDAPMENPEELAASSESRPTPSPDNVDPVASAEATPPPSDDLDAATAAAVVPTETPMEIPTENPAVASNFDAAPTPSTDTAAAIAPNNEASAFSSQANDNLSGTIPSEPPVAKPAPVDVIPAVASAPLAKKGATLNRYYFVRKGDTEKSISELIYGSTQNSKQLKKWNKGKFRIGKLVYYQSPTEPADATMKSLYEERQLQPKEVTVGKRDTLKKIANRELGSRLSWTEVAVTNGVVSVDGISEGMKLNVYPDLKGAPPAVAEAQDPRANEAANAAADAAAANAANPYAQNGQPPNPAAAPPPGVDPAQMAGQPPGAPVADPNAPIPAPEPPKKKKQAREGLDVGKIVAQNSGFLLLLAGLMGVGGGLIALNRRKKSQREEFNEDGFAPQAKKRK